MIRQEVNAMEASVVDLRYKTRKVLNALDRRETVTLTYRGKVRGYIVPADQDRPKAKEHPFFGSDRKNKVSVAKEARELRRGRFSDL
jgi:antitoxin (DNA-binding transcriptional repressor) of toxin-antitoxin stability system